MSTLSVYFHGEIRKISIHSDSKKCLLNLDWSYSNGKLQMLYLQNKDFKH